MQIILIAHYSRMEKLKYLPNSIKYENYRISKMPLINNKTITRFKQCRQELFFSCSQSRNIQCSSSLTSFSKYDLKRLFRYMEVKTIRHIIFSIILDFHHAKILFFLFALCLHFLLLKAILNSHTEHECYYFLHSLIFVLAFIYSAPCIVFLIIVFRFLFLHFGPFVFFLFFSSEAEKHSTIPFS